MIWNAFETEPLAVLTKFVRGIVVHTAVHGVPDDQGGVATGPQNPRDRFNGLHKVRIVAVEPARFPLMLQVRPDLDATQCDRIITKP